MGSFSTAISTIIVNVVLAVSVVVVVRKVEGGVP